MAGQLFAQALPAVTEFTSPRAWAFSLLGIHEYLRRLGGDASSPRPARHSRPGSWTSSTGPRCRTGAWFEDEISYDNAKLAHALILTGRGDGTGESA